jgi:Mannosyltransferase OCH1 and related enzymes
LGWSEPPTALVSIPDTTPHYSREQAIPPIVFQTAESRMVHPTHAKSISEFREKNQDLAFRFFDAHQRDEYMETRWTDTLILDVYRRSVFGQMKADIFRYCIVFEKGGYYFDFNKGCTEPLTSFHGPEATGLVSYESNPELIFPNIEVAHQLSNPFNLVLQWAFGFAPQHRFLELVIDRIVEIEPFFRARVFPNPKEALLTMSAPGVFTDVFRRYVAAFGIGTIVEAGEDFFGAGVFRLRGSKFLQNKADYYGHLANKSIVRDKNGGFPSHSES